jgi:16S rRNA (uracil1498-N3)-methyltransferase
MAAPRFLIERIPASGEIAWLPREEARHALGSRRLGVGDPIELVDGRGGLALACVCNDRDRDGNLAALVSEVRHAPRPRPAIHVATAVPKGDRLSSMLDAAGELAVESLTPLDCERSVVPADRLGGERPARILVEAMKQSRGLWCTEVRPPSDPVAFARHAHAAGHRVLLLDPEGPPLVRALEGAALIALLVGPEGGFSEIELAQILSAGAAKASLGPGILRIELAVAVACGAIRAAHEA